MNNKITIDSLFSNSAILRKFGELLEKIEEKNKNKKSIDHNIAKRAFELVVKIFYGCIKNPRWFREL